MVNAYEVLYDPSERAWKGFYKVYGDHFGKISDQEVSFANKLGLGLGVVRDAPLMGNLESPYEQSRRLMEEENKKSRKKARKEYNDMIRVLAEFVKKRDKRVIEMQMKRNQEQKKKRENESIQKKEAQQAKLVKASLYEEPEWAKIDEKEFEKNGFDEPEDDKKMQMKRN
ncbi:hypothetical protein NE237_006905 [Protea cynaroides]|uniref:Uncharacterized protein n=1 Tax=Protea cynaroides TaxID=273540 RepID=A0A9Q0KP55_9MAGN|nr:hypothetical protein NE237_006905 [Protea cynaroides]